MVVLKELSTTRHLWGCHRTPKPHKTNLIAGRRERWQGIPHHAPQAHRRLRTAFIRMSHKRSSLKPLLRRSSSHRHSPQTSTQPLRIAQTRRCGDIHTFLPPQIQSQNQHLSQCDVGRSFLTLRMLNLVTYPANTKVPMRLDSGGTNIHRASRSLCLIAQSRVVLNMALCWCHVAHSLTLSHISRSKSGLLRQLLFMKTRPHL
jgi:hypothetical protein